MNDYPKNRRRKQNGGGVRDRSARRVVTQNSREKIRHSHVCTSDGLFSLARKRFCPSFEKKTFSRRSASAVLRPRSAVRYIYHRCHQKLLLRSKTVRSNAAASSRSTVASSSGYGTSTPLRSKAARRRRAVLSSRRRRRRLSRLTLHLEARTSSRRSHRYHHHSRRLFRRRLNHRYSSSSFFFSLSMIEGLSGRRSTRASSTRRF